MIQATISKNSEKQTISATGSITELAVDIAILISGIHAQLKASSPAAADLFRAGIQKMAADNNGPFWTPRGNYTGIAIELPGDRHDP